MDNDSAPSLATNELPDSDWLKAKYVLKTPLGCVSQELDPAKQPQSIVYEVNIRLPLIKEIAL